MTASKSPSEQTSRSEQDSDELDPAARRRVRLGGLIGALAGALLVASPIFLPPLVSRIDPDTKSGLGLPLSQPLFDRFQRYAAGTVSPRIVVIKIDDASVARYGGWPWSRLVMYELVRVIAAQEPAVIGFDLFFSEPDRLTPQAFLEAYPDLSRATSAEIAQQEVSDYAFGREIGRAPAVLARFGVHRGGTDSPINSQAPPILGAVAGSIREYPRAVTNIPDIDGSALGFGLVNSEPDRDGYVRAIPVVARVARKLTPSLALEMVRVAENAEQPVQLIGDARRLRMVRVADHSVLTTPDGRMRLHYLSMPNDQLISAADVMRGAIGRERLKGKIVLVGLTAAGSSDVVNTPRVTQTFGVFVQAQAIDAVLRSRALARPGWAIGGEWLAGLAAVFAALLILPRLRLIVITASSLALPLGAMAASWVAFQNGLLLDPAPVVLPGVGAAGAMIAMLFVEGRRLQRQLRADLEVERIEAARMAGEMAAAEGIQAGMLVPRNRLGKLAPGIELDAVLQPARTVGGDLYDAFSLPGGRLCFAVGDATGKGLPAALFMALAKAITRSLLTQPQLNLAQALQAINVDLSADNAENMQLSLLVGVVHPDGRLEMVCAGHDNPFLVGLDGKVRTLKLDGGPPLCAMEGFAYPLEIYRLEPGEILVAYTDGVTEAQDRSGDLLGTERAAAAVAQAAGTGPLPDLVDRVVKAVRAFENGAEPSDDLTILAVRRAA